MQTHDFYYDLPQELIAQTPIEKRDTSRLMTLDRRTGEVGHHHFYDLPDFLNPGDCLILNDSRVLPARLLGQRLPGGGACEVLLLTDKGDKVWECLVRPGRKLRQGTRLTFGEGALTAEIVEVLEEGNRLIRFDYEGIFLETLEKLGKPYAYGSSGPDSFDCSGFVNYCYSTVGISVPRTSSEIGAMANISADQLQPGDILWSPGHVSIYLGDGTIIHSEKTGTGVIAERLQEGALAGYQCISLIG